MVTPRPGKPIQELISRVFASLFFLVFLGMGSVFFVFILLISFRQLATYRWTPTQATVIESRVDEPQSSKHDRTVYVKYHYTFSGKRYENDRYEIDAPVATSSDAFRLVQNFAPGSTRTCYVNPSNPGQAVLHRGALWMLLVAAFPLIFVAVGLGGLIAVWKKKLPSSLAGGRPISETPSTRAPKTWFLVLFFGIFFAVGAGLTYTLAIRPLTKIVSAQSWQEVPCEIVSSRVKSNSDSDGTTYGIDIVFRYRVAGRSFTSNTYSFVTGSSSGYAGKAAVVNENPPGRSTQCFVNPSDPSEAVLNRNLRPEMAFGLIPLLFLGIGLGGIIWSIRRRAKPASPWTATAVTTVERSPMTTLDVGEHAGPTALRPKTSRLAKLIIFLGLGLFWNGIISIFVYGVVTGWLHGRGSIFETLFLIPFLLVGIGLVVGAAYQALALTNPNARIIVSQPAVRLGQTLDISWELDGVTARVRALRIEFEGREEATFRRGTSTSTDRSPFARIIVFDTTEASQIRSGSARLQVPVDTMHSFKATNNQIVWSLKLKGDIPRWPDIEDEYVISVLPLSVSSHTHERT